MVGQNNFEERLESPVWHFPSTSKISATFIFATRLVPKKGKPQTNHIRLRTLYDELRKDSRICDALIEPSKSFLDDMVRGGLGRLGHPLVFLCEPKGKRERDERNVVIRRPTTTTFRSEGYKLKLIRPNREHAETRWKLRDAFVLFESGHLLYLLSLVSRSDQIGHVDEYAMIQLQKLLHSQSETTDLRSELKFSLDPDLSICRTLASPSSQLQEQQEQQGEPSPPSLIEARLERLANSISEEPNGMRHVLQKHVLKDAMQPLKFEWSDLKSLVFAVEDNGVFGDFAGRHTQLHNESQGREDKEVELPEGNSPETVPESQLVQLHLEPRCPRSRLYALSGFIRGIFGFPIQNTAELEDSLEPTYELKDEWVIFANHGCLAAIASGEWRSLQEGRTSLGTCPYLLTAHCMALYHELLVSALEDEIDALLYQRPDSLVSEKPIHAEAMRDLLELLQRARDAFRLPSIKMPARKLQKRIDIVRDLLIFRPINIFSYKVERDLYEELIAYKKIQDRTAALMDLLDRYEGLVEDSHQIVAMSAERRLSFLFAIVAVMGVLSVYEPLEALLGNQEYHLVSNYHMDWDRWLFVGAAFVFLIGCALWSRRK